ncbi:hypothetical protein BWD42_01135 [Sphingobacterium sp. CZ-UAM]|jgi:hypothetical protein|nr:hypothetical protein BWD42_01135 [Sphingobacterium sp. CZ-UAM]
MRIIFTLTKFIEYFLLNESKQRHNQLNISGINFIKNTLFINKAQYKITVLPSATPKHTQTNAKICLKMRNTKRPGGRIKLAEYRDSIFRRKPDLCL